MIDFKKLNEQMGLERRRIPILAWLRDNADQIEKDINDGFQEAIAIQNAYTVFYHFPKEPGPCTRIENAIVKYKETKKEMNKI
ncbi:hypothetical protein KKH23_07420 [Patescibacteria group bacterium]|nr:hypothetical protein [Patescibacteria group bacterium]